MRHMQQYILDHSEVCWK